jgi:hemolysin activation/secretion protein
MVSNRRRLASVRFGVTLCALGLAAGQSAWGQSTPAPVLEPDASRSHFYPVPPPAISVPTAPPQTAPLVEASRPDGSAPPGSEDIITQVAGITVEGATVYTEAELAEYSKDLIGKEAPLTAIFEVARQISQRYHEDGYVLSEALVPEQRVSDGHFTIRVVEGYVSQVVVQGDVGPVGALIKAMVKRIPESKPANSAEIERYLLLARDLPGISLTGVFRQAAGASGARELVVTVARQEVAGSIAYDNRGSRFLGPGELSAGLQINSLSRLGDRVDFTFFNTLGIGRPGIIAGANSQDEQRFGEFSYSGNIGSDGLQFRVYAGAGPANPGYTLAKSHYHSELVIAGGGLTYPIIRSRALNLTIASLFEMSNTTIRTGNFLPAVAGENQRLTSAAHLRVSRTTLSGDVKDEWGGFSAASLTLHHGFPRFGADNDLHFATTGSGQTLRPLVDAKSDFTKFTWEASRLQHLFSTSWLSADLQLSAEGQWALDLLYPSEQFRLGGFTYGRGYFSGRMTGDHGFGTTAELQFNPTIGLPFSDDDWNPQIYTFFDAGRTFSKTPKDKFDRATLRSTGIGIRTPIFEDFRGELEFDRPLYPSTYDVSSGKAPKPPIEFFFRLIATF